jgi:hypothetical protein
MRISENEIDSIEPFGMLNGKSVNLVRLKGGLNLATVVNPKGEDVLGAASHQAIQRYSLEQRFPDFQPMLMKSEGLNPTAESHSHFLCDSLRKSGHDIYSVQNGNNIEFVITKQNIRVGTATGSISGNQLIVNSLEVPKEFVLGLSGAVGEKALGVGLKEVRMK